MWQLVRARAEPEAVALMRAVAREARAWGRGMVEGVGVHGSTGLGTGYARGGVEEVDGWSDGLVEAQGWEEEEDEEEEVDEEVVCARGWAERLWSAALRGAGNDSCDLPASERE